MSAEAVGWVLRHSPYKGAAFACHLVVADTVNAAYGFEFWMSGSNLARFARCGRSAASAWLVSAREDGTLTLLTQGGGRYKTSRYRFEMPDTEVDLATDRETVQNPRSLESPILRDFGPNTARSAKRNCPEIAREPKEITQEEPKLRAVDDFDAWWQVYPRKTEKSAARTLYAWHRAHGATAEQLLTAAVRYRDDPARKPDFTKMARTFLARKDPPWRDWLEPEPDETRDVPIDGWISQAELYEIDARRARESNGD